MCHSIESWGVMRSPVSFHRRLGLYVDRWWMTSTIDKALPPTPSTEISLEMLSQ